MNREELKQVEMRHGAKRFRLSCPVAWEHVRESANLHEYLALFLSRDDVVIDAAPGYGRDTVFFAGVVGCRVTAVAADQNGALLQGNLEANGLLQRIAVIDVDALREHASAIPAGRLRLVRIDENVPADAIEALVATLVRDRAVLVCAGLGSDASAALALRLSAHRYTALATLDESRCFLMAPVGDSREVARLARFLRCCPAWGGDPAALHESPQVEAVRVAPVDAPVEKAPAAPAPQLMPQLAPVIDEAVSADLRDLREQLARIDARSRQQLEIQRDELRQLAAELRARLAQAEQRHEALLNGRIFRTLGAIARVVRRLQPAPPRTPGKVVADTLASAAAAPIAHVTPAPTAVTTDPERLPPPERVPLAGVPYMCRPMGGVSGADVVYPGEPLITVVMTTYNTEPYVEAAVRSILDQTWRNLELIVVDDCSTDGTRSKIEAIRALDPRVKLYCFGENRGTYFCKNFGITQSSGAVVTFMDSDDISEPRRLELQFKALNQPGFAVSTCNHVRKDESGQVILINGVAERVAYISQMVKRKVFEEIGYFDTIRTSADDEFLRRVRITYGTQAQTNVKDVLYIALLRDGSLTRDPANAINFVQQRNSTQSFLSPQRRHYAAMCDRWHKYLGEKNLRPYMPFPVVRRPFPVFGRLVVDGGRYDGNRITACLATYPPREEKLRAVVAALLPQVDQIQVYLNNYTAVPDFLRHSRITTVLGKEDLRDNGKFYFPKDLPRGYCFTVDDDLAYPPDYVQAMIRKIEFYERKAVVGLHGTVYAKPIRSFFKGRTLLHFEEALEVDTVVNQLGTGTVAFHTDLWRPQLDWFKTTGMADVWLAMQARRMRIPFVAVAREGQWLLPIGTEETTLFREFRKSDEMQTALVRELAPWKEELSKELAASMAGKRRKLGTAYAMLLPRLGIAEDAPRP
ncbi:glycosyltransferase family A protein [Lysobacter sp. Root494]|uniref:glycosyltransferase family A protein n=1 Tax=Lysobacter sp. Root494 TaxID=1736549 RepID=UPI0006FB9971|nr:glycosyltransferase family A protein [Lysobacter sp. Root494]KQY49820.1 hypothetical protein ASD14_13955 [Lysobacter sp. Root494]